MVEKGLGRKRSWP